MKFLNDESFYEKFKQIEDIKYYPYVGLDYSKQDKKILVFAHNMYCEPKDYENHKAQKSSPTHFSNAIDEYTYEHAKWTKAFRNYIKGSLSLKKDYHINSNQETTDEINKFVSRIAFTNYINDLVASETANNVNVPNELVEKSHLINKELISILNPTHILCWGKNVYDYLLNSADKKESKNLNEFDGLEHKNGFAYSKIEFHGKTIHLLKTFHPSMPSFGHYNLKTQNILKWFYNL